MSGPVLVTPAFVAGQADTGDLTKLGPNAWNAARIFAGGLTGEVLMRDPASATGASWSNTSLLVGPAGATGAAGAPGAAGPTGPAGPSAWGGITGSLTTQTDLQTALDAKVGTARTVNAHALTGDVVVTKSDVGLGAVENTALSTWTGSTALTVLGGSPADDGVANHTRVSLAGLILDINTDPLNANFSFNELTGLYAPTLGLGGVGHDNFFLGLHTGTHCTTGCGNLAIGHSALASIVDGIRNVSIGWDTHLHQVSGSWNVTIGVDAMRAGLGSNNVAIGDQAGLENSGSDNVIIGKAALDAIAASQYNVAIGEFSLTSATSNRNTGIGYSTLSSAVAGADNTALGFQAGRLALGSGNVFLGFNAGNRETGSNKLYIDNNGGSSEANGRTQALIYGVFDANVANQRLTFNALVTATDLTVTNPIVGSLAGNAATATLAGTATVLQTPRTINGVAFDGSGNITVAAAAGTLTGAALAAGVTASSLTSVGTLAMLTVTAAIAGSVTGNAATATALQTGRAINGVTFDGTAAITVTAAASTLTGTTLNATVTASSLTSVGTLAGLAVTTSATVTRDALVTTSTDGIVIQNTSAATVGVPVQITPRLRFRGAVWNTTAGGATNTDDWWFEATPTSSASPTSTFRLYHSLNGAAANATLTIDGFGQWTAPSTITAGGSGFLRWASSSIMSAPATGQINLSPSANTLGVGLDFLTDGVLKVRTRAQTGYATVDALGYKASGTAGVSFGPAAPASITIVNGIVTACS